MDEERVGSQAEGKLEDDVDALFKLPLSEFIGARNSLAASLKRVGRADDANLVKALAKPSISAWAVNQLHWNHREAFNSLMATSQGFRQASNTAGRMADVRVLLDARREALSHLSDLATGLLRDAGHNPAPDTIHRILTTLEAISGYATPSDGPTPGRLTQDVDPPGFGSLASLVPSTDTTERNGEVRRVTPSPTSDSAATETGKRRSPDAAGEIQKARQAQETHRARIAAAKAALQEARKSLTEVRSRAQRLEAAHKKADAEAKEADAEARRAEKQLREAEEHFKKASSASQDAAHRTQRMAAEAEEAAQAVAGATRTVEDASTALESLQESGAG